MSDLRVGKPVPVALRCRWRKRPGPFSVCLDCGVWTADRPMDETDICSAKDRRAPKEGSQS